MPKPNPLRMRVPLGRRDSTESIRRFGRSPKTAAIEMLPWDLYGTTRWSIQRRSMVGASEIAAVLGHSPWASPFSLWWAKQEGWEWEGNLATRLGHEFEPIIGKLFGEARPDLIVCRPKAALWRHPVVDVIGCSPDFLAVAPGCYTCGGTGRTAPSSVHYCLDCAGNPGLPTIEPVECKSDEGGAGWGKPGSDEVPDHHWMQLVQQCMVFGSTRGHLVRMAGKRFATYTVNIDQHAADWFAEAVTAAEAFMASLLTGVAPELDGHDATTDTLERLHPTADEALEVFVPADLTGEWFAAKDALDAAKDRERTAGNRLRAALGDARFGKLPNGTRVADRRVYKRKGYEVAPAMVDALYPMNRPKATTVKG